MVAVSELKANPFLLSHPHTSHQAPISPQHTLPLSTSFTRHKYPPTSPLSPTLPHTHSSHPISTPVLHSTLHHTSHNSPVTNTPISFTSHQHSPPPTHAHTHTPPPPIPSAQLPPVPHSTHHNSHLIPSPNTSHLPSTYHVGPNSFPSIHLSSHLIKLSPNQIITSPHNEIIALTPPLTLQQKTF